ncbi:hypothetical protein PPL_10058 [Heterostelium album PN500]|uniref:Uncharacterized protein n=1 Tax=Heterostelium pallidum (strain ATCC 26659 / Pp 5 / PN500) TaxID=670386 RepID=D3BQ75_HETP5|nr:hypothetical protein PPL_10058 [Heterostelium album PN500]EFA76295.1 hypothetical protein PPL_10058 [Heterostelium album PN500]|eukprot:XP_020428427.1 hypothetical protein PPL_10058 [Heterostelium album PN500]
MSKLPDYYKILEIEINADSESIKKAYKRMALKYHPDRNRGGTKEKDSEETFKLVSEAYAVLSDTDKRREYDAAIRGGSFNVGVGGGVGGMGGFDEMRFHRHPMNPDEVFSMFNQFFSKPFSAHHHHHHTPFSSFHGAGGPPPPPQQVDPFASPFFDSFFNGGPSSRSPFSAHHNSHHNSQHHHNHQNFHNNNLNNSRHNIHVDDEDDIENLTGSPGGGSSSSSSSNGNHSMNGLPTRIYHKLSLFLSFKETVYGTERQIHFPIKIECGHCLGTGSSTKQREFTTCQRCNGNGRVTNFLLAFACDVCNGQGVILKNTCNYCHGDGLISQQYEDSILIPAGISNGSTAKSLTFDEHDVQIKFSVEQHPFFQREGNNVVISVPLSTTQAMFGCKIDVPTIYGKNIQINVPPYESQSKYGLVVHRHGFKDPDGQKVGDMICNFKPEFPTLSNLTPREKELIKGKNLYIPFSIDIHSLFNFY